MNDIINHRKDTIKGYADPAKTDFQLNMPIYILTSKQTFSGAEDFCYGMQHAKRAVIVGDTTGGGAHPTRPFNIGQGFVASIPLARSYNINTQTDWEGTGVRPDVAVLPEEALTKAQELIFTELLANIKDEREKNIFRWNLNNLRAKTAKMPDSAGLSSYQGVFEGGLDFHIKDGRLFCKNAERRNALFELKYITNNLFVLDENVHVEFLKDPAGNYSKIKMHWKRGMITEKKKI